MQLEKYSRKVHSYHKLCQTQLLPKSIFKYKSRGEVSLLEQFTIWCEFLAYFDPNKYTLALIGMSYEIKKNNHL